MTGACTGAVTGAAEGAVISGGIEYLKTRDMQATKQAAIDGAADGFMWGSVTGAGTGGMTSPYCFVAGTLVCTVDGEVPIEDIEVGDYVLAENPETGEIDYKPVLETYEHDTYDVVYLTIDGEEFITTEGHPFYTLERGFVKAGELRYSDTLVDANGAKLHLDEKSKAHLENPVTVYNFAVEDYHTYFVGENDVLVHNNCEVTRRQAFREAKEAGGIPKSAQYKTHKFVFDGSTENRMVYEFNVNGKSKYIVEHQFDKLGRGSHFHVADASKGSPFIKGRYNQFRGHFPELFQGFK